jgi:hypothetical protein
MTMEIGHERLEACDIVVMHLLLIVVEASRNGCPLGCQGATEQAVVDLSEGGTLDLVLQSRVLRMVLTTDHSPENSVLGLGVENHTIEVEKGCLE